MTLKKIEFARAWADKAVADYVRTEVSTPEGPSATWAWERFGLEYVDRGKTTYIHVPARNTQSLLMLGLIDEHVCGLMRTVVASQIEAGLCYDIWLRKFAAAYLNGTLAPIPKSRGRQVSGNWDRNLFLIESIQTLTERFGLKPSRNEASAPDRATGQSASEILSDGFAKHNRHEVTPRAIEEVWKDKKVRNWASVIQTEMATRRLDVDQPNLLGLAMMGLSPDSPERSDDDLRTYMRMFPAKFGSRR